MGPGGADEPSRAFRCCQRSPDFAADERARSFLRLIAILRELSGSSLNGAYGNMLRYDPACCHWRQVGRVL